MKLLSKIISAVKIKMNFIIYSIFETASKRKTARLKRPKLVMKSLAEEMAFKNMGQAGGEICFTELYNAGQISQVIQKTQKNRRVKNFELLNRHLFRRQAPRDDRP